MAITTVQGLRDGIQPRVNTFKNTGSYSSATGLETTWPAAGWDTTGVYNATLNGIVLANTTPGSVPGSIRLPQSSGSTVRIGRHEVTSGTLNQWFLCDRLWHNGGINNTSTSLQSITSPTWPARDANGTTNGEGVMLALEVNAATGAGAPTITVMYTNSSGTGSRTAVNLVPTGVAQNRTVYILTLQDGDIGVRSVQSIQYSASWTSGMCHLVAFRLITAAGRIAALNYTTPYDMLACDCPLVHHESVLYYMHVNNAAICSTIYTSIG